MDVLGASATSKTGVYWSTNRHLQHCLVQEGTNTEEWSGLGGGKGAAGLGQEDLNFLFIAAMKLWAGRQAGWQRVAFEVPRDLLLLWSFQSVLPAICCCCRIPTQEPVWMLPPAENSTRMALSTKETISIKITNKSFKKNHFTSALYHQSKKTVISKFLFYFFLYIHM